MVQIGRYELHAIETGRFRLDGGAMFGVVPRVLWSQHTRPDELNRIDLCMRSLLAIDRGSGRIILVDSGAGQKWNQQEAERFALDPAYDGLGGGLRGLGISDEQVTDVIVTHLHFDHNGGLTLWADAPGGALRPRFPGAVHWIHADHLAHARNPALKDRASFYARDFEAVGAQDLFRLVDGPAPQTVLPGIEWFVAGGHTPAQLLPRFVDGNRAVQFVADLIPTTMHLSPAWVMAYDNEPLKTIREKLRLYDDCSAGEVLLFFEHDPEVTAARLDLSGKRPVIAEQVAF